MIKRLPRAPSPNANQSFDKADGDLEAAQNLCEVAAHQFLRDGDCGEELAGTRERFEDCFMTAKEEVQRLRAERSNDTEADTTNSASAARKPAQADNSAVVVAAEKIQAPRIPTVPTLTTSGTIEVDDDSDASSVHIDLSAFRRTRRV